MCRRPGHTDGRRVQKGGELLQCCVRTGGPRADHRHRPETAGRLSEVCDRWVYTACPSLRLAAADQTASVFAYDHSIYLVEYSRDLLFANRARVQRTFEAIVRLTRSRLDVKTTAPCSEPGLGRIGDRAAGLPRLEVVIGTPMTSPTSRSISGA